MKLKSFQEENILIFHLEQKKLKLKERLVIQLMIIILLLVQIVFQK